MKKILFKLFPILSEEMPVEYLEKDNQVNRLCVLVMHIGVAVGCVSTLLIVEIINKLLKK